MRSAPTALVVLAALLLGPGLLLAQEEPLAAGSDGLPDPKHSVLKRYGQEIKLFKLGRMPAQVIVDKQGQARYAHY